MKIEKKYLTAPLTAQLEMTDFCNHKCIHCYNLDSKVENRLARKVSDEIVLASAQKLIDSGIFAVVVTGGEPLIKKELTKKVITLFCNNNIRVSLNSNLTLFDDKFISFLKQKKVSVLTSCPSSVPVSYERLVGIDNYSKFETSIKKLVSAEIRFTINMVVTKDNLHEIIETAQKMKVLGCKSFAATPMGLNMDYPRLDLLLSIEDVQNVIVDLLWIKENLDLNVDILEALPKCVFPEKILTERHSFLNRKCQAGRTVIAVSCNGDVRPCAHNPISYGSIIEDDLKTIWVKMTDWRSAQYVPSDCKECTWLNRCNGGCRTSAKTIGGEWNSKEMWATAPLKTLPPKSDKQIELKPETQLQVNPDYKCRQEDEDENNQKKERRTGHEHIMYLCWSMEYLGATLKHKYIDEILFEYLGETIINSYNKLSHLLIVDREAGKRDNYFFPYRYLYCEALKKKKPFEKEASILTRKLEQIEKKYRQ